ncbi:MAG: hypothetical protein IJV78_05285 [Clostridia bacterium]|nr:hypothetical protein [Clostridia bacterium]
MQLKEKLALICKTTDTNEKGINLLLEYYQKSLGWSEEKAIAYVIDLFENGTIDAIKGLGAGDSKNSKSRKEANNGKTE